MNKTHAAKQVRYLRTRTRWMEYAPERTRKAIKVIWSLHHMRTWTVYDIMRVLRCSRTIAQRVAALLVSSRIAYKQVRGHGKHRPSYYAWTIDRIIAADAAQTTSQETSYVVPDDNATLTHAISTDTNQSEENKRSRRMVKRKRKSGDVMEDLRCKSELRREPLKVGYPYWRDIMRRMRTGLAVHNVPAHLIRMAVGSLARMLARLKATIGQAVDIAAEIYRALIAQARLTYGRIRWIVGNIVRRLYGKRCGRPVRVIDAYYTARATCSASNTTTQQQAQQPTTQQRRTHRGIHAIGDILTRAMRDSDDDQPTRANTRQRRSPVVSTSQGQQCASYMICVMEYSPQSIDTTSSRR